MAGWVPLTSDTLEQPTRQYLRDLRNKLLHLHKTLLQTERIAYEQLHGQVSSRELLQLVMENEQFAWLRRISQLVVQIDDLLRADEPVSPEDIQNLITYTRTLLVPSETGNTFERKYYNALQSEPDVVLAHADVSKLLADKK